MCRPFSVVYQPIEEIRDYYGDEVGLYFGWLGHYTKSLMMSSLFGTIVMIAQFAFKDDNGHTGPDQNPLTLIYSVYVGMWSIVFLETWKRREAELRFCWGSEGLAEVDEPRREFIGVLEVNPDTGRQRLVARSNFEQNAKKIVSYTIVLLMIVITASCASMAYLVRYLATASFLLSVVISPPRPKNFILPLCVLVLRLAHTRVGWWL